MAWEKVVLDGRRETKDERKRHPEQNDRIHAFSCHSERSVSGVEESREVVL